MADNTEPSTGWLITYMNSQQDESYIAELSAKKKPFQLQYEEDSLCCIVTSVNAFGA